jgi:lipoyl(octanoyl) transferase
VIRAHPRKSVAKNLISVLQLGTLDYATGLRLQQRLVELRKAGQISDVLLLLEHTPVITLGRNAKAGNVIASPEQLTQRGAEVFDCDRGGDVTFHGPGQIVGYPIFDLRGFFSSDGKRKTLGAVEYVRRLEEVLIRTCADFGVPAKRISGLPGVWTTLDRAGPGLGSGPGGAETRPHTAREEAKIAALGVHISRGVTSHGFALNVNTDLSFFDLIIPCGIESKPVTSMEKELGKQLPLQDVAHSISRNFGLVFESQILWLESLDALLGQFVGVPMKPPAELRELHKEEDTFRA